LNGESFTIRLLLQPSVSGVTVSLLVSGLTLHILWCFHSSVSSSFLACNSQLRSAKRRHHPPHRAVLSQICFGERKVVLFQILLDGTVLSHVMRGRPSCLLQSARGEANRILLASALSSMRIICQNRVSWRDWIIAVSLGCFVSSSVCVTLKLRIFEFEVLLYDCFVYRQNVTLKHFTSMGITQVRWET